MVATRPSSANPHPNVPPRISPIDYGEINSIMDDFRSRAQARESHATMLMQQAYTIAMGAAVAEANRWAASIQADKDAGKPVKRYKLQQEQRYRDLIKLVQGGLDDYAGVVRSITAENQRAGIQDSYSTAGQLLQSLTNSPEVSRLAAGWNALPERTIQGLVGALQAESPLGKLLATFPKEGAKAVGDQLLRAVSAGYDVRRTQKAVSKALAIPVWRAQTIVRTETLRATRGGLLDAYKQSGIVKGWRWSAALSKRTCPACLHLNGKVFPLTTPFMGHVNCRCSPSPVMDMGAPAPHQSGDEWLRAQPPAVQDAILTKAGGAGFRAGKLGLQDWVGTRSTPEWGTSFQARSFRQANGYAIFRGAGMTPAEISAVYAPKPRKPSAAPSKTPAAPAAPPPAPMAKSIDLVNYKMGGKYASAARREEYERVLQGMDSVHHWGGTATNIPVQWVKSSSFYGQFTRRFTTRPKAVPDGIKIDAGGRRRSTIAHEMGHYLDLVLPGVDGEFISRYGLALHLYPDKAMLGAKFAGEGIVVPDSMVRLMGLLNDSETMKRIYSAGHAGGFYTSGDGVVVKVPGSQLEYYVEPHEMFARGYAQYIGVRATDESVRTEIMAEIGLRRRPDSVATQWGDAEFEPIAEAFDAYFEEIGWKV